MCRQSLTRKERTLAVSLQKPFSHQSYQVALATNYFPPLPEMVGTLVRTIPLSTNEHHPLSQDAQPRRLGGEQTSLPHLGARGLSMPECARGTQCNGPNWEKGATGSSGAWRRSWAGARRELTLAQVQPLGKRSQLPLPGLSFRQLG